MDIDQAGHDEQKQLQREQEEDEEDCDGRSKSCSLYLGLSQVYLIYIERASEHQLSGLYQLEI